MFGKLAKLTSVVTALAMLLAVGSAMTMAQSLDTSGATLDSGTEGLRDQLIAETVSALAHQNIDAKSFNFEQAIVSPQSDAVFVPLKGDNELENTWKEFNNGTRKRLVTGILYNRTQFIFNGTQYQPGLHEVVLDNPGISGSQPANVPDNTEAKSPREHQTGIECTGDCEINDNTVVIVGGGNDGAKNGGNPGCTALGGASAASLLTLGTPAAIAGVAFVSAFLLFCSG